MTGSEADLEPFFESLHDDALAGCVDEGFRLLMDLGGIEVDELTVDLSPVDAVADDYVGLDGVGVLTVNGQSAPVGFTMGIGRAGRMVAFGLLLVIGNDIASIDASEVVGRSLDAAGL